LTGVASLRIWLMAAPTWPCAERQPWQGQATCWDAFMSLRIDCLAFEDAMVDDEGGMQEGEAVRRNLSAGKDRGEISWALL
jgi:hypothetical protein